MSSVLLFFFFFFFFHLAWIEQSDDIITGMASPVHTRQHLLNTRNERQSRKSVTPSTHTSTQTGIMLGRGRIDVVEGCLPLRETRLLSVYVHGLIGLNVCATLTALWARGHTIFETEFQLISDSKVSVGLAGKLLFDSG